MSANYNSNNRKCLTVRGKFQRSYDQKEMTFEVERRKTFKAWSNTCQVKPNSLAKAGFFYVGIFDRVKCFSCGGQIEGWEEGDTAMDEHKKMYPHCHMVKNQDKRNVTIEKWNEMQKRLGQRTEEVDGEIVWGKHKTLTSDDCVDAFCETSYEKLSASFQPLFGGELDRLNTFRDNWLEEYKLPSSETRWLANAGFYYTGPGDRARCFYCKGGIENWKGDDEPWSEHARCFPTCEWLKEMIGKDFVDEVQDFFKNAKASEQAEKREPKQNPAVSTQSSPLGRQKTPDSVAVSAHMDSPTVQTIVKAGYDPALVRRVLEAQLHVRETGLNFSFSDNFIKTLDAAEKGRTQPLRNQWNIQQAPLNHRHNSLLILR
ncbi:baculoviral IAP repeat-containing protein 7 [Strongylocentrotus purpuratus]|uniref:Uncharacterized protein n=1 Tax=Strongylocentrotus purpuratus TaxID=7668 RepID=A0A7M7PJL4_STRPU|nr:baculoviral IAP repeat-containing protein 7 [Strongylocentrotus purpuratus]